MADGQTGGTHSSSRVGVDLGRCEDDNAVVIDEDSTSLYIQAASDEAAGLLDTQRRTVSQRRGHPFSCRHWFETVPHLCVMRNLGKRVVPWVSHEVPENV